MSVREWTFLSNHAHVLICIARDPDSRVRDIADQVGLTVRAVQRILLELQTAGFLDHERIGRRNHYTINLDGQLRHPLEGGASIRNLLRDLVDPKQLRAASIEAKNADAKNAGAKNTGAKNAGSTSTSGKKGG
tara:strand:+ start:20306 stop:20704 length:399 start_codon:yes stop_codon:yes gene_type:complete